MQEEAPSHSAGELDRSIKLKYASDNAVTEHHRWPCPCSKVLTISLHPERGSVKTRAILAFDALKFSAD